MSRSQLLPHRMATASIAGAAEVAGGLKGIGIEIVKREGKGVGQLERIYNPLQQQQQQQKHKFYATSTFEH